MNKIKIFSLGGLNENGKNMYVVEVNEDIFIFDAGLKYPDDKLFGIDYILPNYDFIEQNKERIKGIFISHGHDEQMGAIPDILMDHKDINVYGTKFTLELLKKELEQEKIEATNLMEIKPHQKITFGDNSVFPISLSHSIPDAVGFVLNTKDGAIVYTSNFVIDPTMLKDYKTDIGKLAYVGKQGVLCLMAESLYADKKGFTSPNHRVKGAFTEILNKTDKRILINIMQAELHRMQELFNALKDIDRKVVILGKKLDSIINHAIDTNYVDFDKSKLASLNHINDENVIVIISDEREKPFSNIKRIVSGYDKFIKIRNTDMVVFASPVYDGLEKTAADLFDDIAKIGANLVIFSSKKYLEYHASSEDLMLMIDLMNPKYYFPVIGEYRHQVANANLANKLGINKDNIILKQNGDVIIFEDGKLIEAMERVKTEEILIDGKTSEDIGAAVLKDRAALSENGIVIVNATLDKRTKKVIAGPEILTRGFIFVKDNNELIKEIEVISLNVLNENIKDNYVDFTKVRNSIRDKLSKFLYQATECNPMILVIIQEV
jgi:ribonuclease J